MQECKVNGPVRALGGQFVANANSFSQDVVIGPAARRPYRRLLTRLKAKAAALFTCLPAIIT